MSIHYPGARHEIELTVVRAVRARDQLLIRALEREPCLQIILLTRCQVQRSRYDGHDAVRDLQALIELFRSANHRVERVPALLRLGDAELLDLLELVHTEDAPHISSGGSCLFAETGGVAGVFDGELRLGRIEPFVGVVCGYGLFGGGDEVLLVIRGNNLSSENVD